MNSSDIPSRITKAFGVNGLKNTIPVDSSTTTDNNGVATFNKGFPPITMQPLSAGGIPPSGKDMNGVLFSVSAQQQWLNAGGAFPYSSDFATAIGGYPKGAVVPNSALTGNWINLNEGNATSPESSTGATTGWVPLDSYGSTTISGLTNSSQTLTSVQASKDRIVLTGNLTSNINIIFPAWVKGWVVSNRCTGNFTVICKTASGSGVSVEQGNSNYIYCDGTNITADFGSAAYRAVGSSNPTDIPDLSSFVFAGSETGWTTKGPGDFVIQGGISSAVSASPFDVQITFNTPFKTKCLAVWPFAYSSVGSSQVAIWTLTPPTLTGCNARAIGVFNQGQPNMGLPYAGLVCNWIAVGI
ncbi:gp53-like domain-containing protein [Enterobacter cloacae]|uniref:gp53-like domain-containing protein n=1 Tax=Enterobacter cloacae TaxID=550 RepID=UPI001010E877|nr:phage tail protein [Enterobacter cloacae]